MRQLYAISRATYVQKLVPDIAVQRGQTRHQLPTLPEIERVEQVEHDPRRLLHIAAPAHAVARLALTLASRKGGQQVLVLLGARPVGQSGRVSRIHWR